MPSSSEGGADHPAMGHPLGGARPGSRTQVVAGASLAIVVLGASQIGAGLMAAVVALAAAIAAAALAREFGAAGLNAPPLLYAGGAALLPLAAYRLREPGLADGVAFLIFMAAARWVLGRPARAALPSIAAFVLSAVYLGFCSGYLVLLRLGGGAKLIVGLAIVAGAFHFGRLLGESSLRGPALAPHLAPAPTLGGFLAGVAGALAGTVAMLSLLHLPIQARLVVELGLPAGAALALGALAWALLRPEDRPRTVVDEDRSELPDGVLSALQAVVLSAPAMFYALRLALH